MLNAWSSLSQAGGWPRWSDPAADAKPVSIAVTSLAQCHSRAITCLLQYQMNWRNSRLIEIRFKVSALPERPTLTNDVLENKCNIC
jgi:hypothetical protein